MKRELIFGILSILIIGCTFSLEKVQPYTPYNIDESVSQSDQKSWESEKISYFSKRPILFDGETLAPANTLFLSNPDGTNTRFIPGTFHSLEFPVSWSLDGNRGLAVLYDEKHSSYCVSLISVDETKCIVSDGYAPSWSPDNNVISYFSYSDTEIKTPSLRLFSMLTSEDKVLMLMPETASSFPSFSSWSSDGVFIAYEVQSPSKKEIWVYSFKTNKTQFLTVGELPMWSPIGNEITFIRDDQLYLYDTEKSKEIFINLPFEKVYWSTWSPDAKNILFVGYNNGDGDIYYLEVEKMSLHQVTNNQLLEEAPSWKP